MDGEFIAYYRVSTQKQGVSGLGLEAQRAQVEAHVHGVGGRILGDFTEVESGKRVTRPQLEAAIAAAKQHGATLIVAKLDRLARNTRYLLKIRDSGIALTFCDLPTIPDGAFGRFMITQMAAVAEFERGLISERTKAAIKAKKARGQPWGTGGRTMARRNRGFADEFARGFASRAKELGLDVFGVTQADLAKQLNEVGLLTPTGKQWKATTTQRLLHRIKRITREARG